MNLRERKVIRPYVFCPPDFARASPETESAFVFHGREKKSINVKTVVLIQCFFVTIFGLEVGLYEDT